MADNDKEKDNPNIYKQSFVSYACSYNEGANIGRTIPDSFKIGRELELYRSKAEGYVLTTLEEHPEKGGENIDILKSIGKNVSLVTLKQINFAMANILYNTSYVCDTLEENTGTAKNGILANGSRAASATINGAIYNCGEIRVKLSDLASEVFGTDEPTNYQKKEVFATLRAMQNIYIEDSTLHGEQLINIHSYQTDAKTGAKVLNIALHPIYAMNVQRNFGDHPQGILKRLGESTKRVTVAQLNLLSLLGIQDRRKPFKINYGNLLEKLELAETVKKQGKKYVAKRLEDAFNAMLKCSIITALPKVSTTSKGETIYTFTLNPDYVKRVESPEQN